MKFALVLFLALSISSCHHTTEPPVDPDAINLTEQFEKPIFKSEWSPDGKVLVGSSMVATFGEYDPIELVLIDANGGGVSTLFRTNSNSSNSETVFGAVFSPDGKRLLYTRRKTVDGIDLNLRFYTYDIANSTENPFPIKGEVYGHAYWSYNPRWNPKGDTIAFIHYGHLYIVPDTGGYPIDFGQVSDPTEQEQTPKLCWSIDGNEVYIGIDHIIAVRIADRRVRLLVDRRILHKKDANSFWTERWLEDPTLSPDGKQIAFYSGAPYDFMKSGTFIYSFSDSNVYLFAINGRYPAWSPDGKWIAYGYGLGDIYKKPVKGE